MRNGIGSYIYACGGMEWRLIDVLHVDRYTGEWKQNDRCGKALYYYHYGGIFEGSFRDDERDGAGKPKVSLMIRMLHLA